MCILNWYEIIYAFYCAVAIQCLETVFDISLEDKASKFPLPANLDVIFEAGMTSLGQEVLIQPESTSAPLPSGPIDKEKAEKYKNEGKSMNITVHWEYVFMFDWWYACFEM